MRIVLDTNILISALITSGTPPDRLYQAWLRDDFELVTLEAQIDEVRDVLARPRLRKYIDSREADRLITAIRLRATVLKDVPLVRRSADPKDDFLLAAAVAGEVDLVVSGDKNDVLALRHVEGIPIRTAREASSLVAARQAQTRR